MGTSVNNKCRAFTSLEQSKKLAEILPLESADMYYWCADHYPKEDWIIEVGTPDDNYECICAWSLAALLEVLPKIYYPIKDHETNLILGKPKDKYCVLYWDVTGMQHGEQTLADNPVDACYEMVLKLHELKML